MEQQVVTGVPDLPVTLIKNKHFDPNCAWCLKKRGIPAGEGSHGMCKPCEDELLGPNYAQFVASRAARRAAKGATA